MAYGIAQLTVPADGFGTPDGGIVDWQRSWVFLWHSNTGSLRSYTAALATQAPLATVSFGANIVRCGDVDPISGDLILQSGTLNGEPLHKYNPTTLALISSFGASTSFPAYPTSLWLGQAMACVECNGVGYALVKESALSGAVGAVRIDTMAHAGFYANVVSGSVNDRGLMCRGASGVAGGSAFLTWDGAVNGQHATLPLYTVIILPGAETYNPATWPTANTFITSATVGTLAAADVDATWTTLQANSIGYDQTDGNVLLDVTGNGATSRYLIKLDAATAAVLWATPLTAAGTALPGYNISDSVAVFFPSNLRDAIDTTDGTDTSAALTGLASKTSVMSDDASGLSLMHVTFTAGAGSPDPVTDTPSSFIGWAILGTTPVAPSVPDPACGGTHTAHSFTAAWTPSGAAATSYDVQYRKVGTTPFTTLTGITAISQLITGLLSGTNYEFKVNAINGAGESGYSALFPCSTDALTRTAKMADLWFGRTGSFVDLSVQSTRRQFVTSVGAAQDLGTTGTNPFGERPAVFLTRTADQPADFFANNMGNAGQFTITGGSLAATSSTDHPLCAVGGLPRADPPLVWLRWSDDRGKTYSNPVYQSTGSTGQYLTSIQWSRTGMARDRVYECGGTIAGPMGINGAFLNPPPIPCKS